MTHLQIAITTTIARSGYKPASWLRSASFCQQNRSRSNSLPPVQLRPCFVIRSSGCTPSLHPPTQPSACTVHVPRQPPPHLNRKRDAEQPPD